MAAIFTIPIGIAGMPGGTPVGSGNHSRDRIGSAVVIFGAHRIQARRQRTHACVLHLAASRFRLYRGRVGMNRSSLSNMNHHRESFRPHLLIVRAHEDAGTLHIGMRSPDEITGRDTPLAGALAPHGVSGTEAGRPLGPTHNPGSAALTPGVFRRSRSVAYIRADASSSEVHVPEIVLPMVT